MVVSNYSDFLILQELKHWEFLSKNISESSSSWEDLVNRIWDYLESAVSKGFRYFDFIVGKLFSYFKSNPKVLILIAGILIANHGFQKSDIQEKLPEDATLTAEEVYNQAKKSEIEKNSPKSKGSLTHFLKAIAAKESSSDPEKINDSGYMGKYQFGKIALEDILLKKPYESDEQYQKRVESFWPNNFGTIETRSDYNYFLTKFTNRGVKFWPEHKQDKAMKQLLKNNQEYLGNYIDKWVGKTKKGIKITKSGLLAGAHLLGTSNVKKFLDQGLVTKDGNGTPITEYIKKFGGYNLNM